MTKTKLLSLPLAIAVLSVTSVYAQFSGPFELGPPGCEDKGLCTLTYNLQYKDSSEVVWQADAQDTTDGASIPAWAQPFIGKPFDKSYIKAAVIHDHYCDPKHIVRPWRQTHRVFYDALVELGVSSVKSKLMYYAVYLGGPKWATLVQGKYCGKNCINIFTSGPEIRQIRAATYQEAGFADDLRDVEKLLNEKGAVISLEDLETRARSKRPNDLYFTHGDRIETNDGLLTK